MVFSYQNCSNLQWEKIVLLWSRKTFEIWGWMPRICKIFEITRTTYSNNFCWQNVFLNMFLKVSHIWWIRTIRILIGKNIEIRNMQEKLENVFLVVSIWKEKRVALPFYFQLYLKIVTSLHVDWYRTFSD